MLSYRHAYTYIVCIFEFTFFLGYNSLYPWIKAEVATKESKHKKIKVDGYNVESSPARETRYNYLLGLSAAISERAHACWGLEGFVCLVSRVIRSKWIRLMRFLKWQPRVRPYGAVYNFKCLGFMTTNRFQVMNLRNCWPVLPLLFYFLALHSKHISCKSLK